MKVEILGAYGGSTDTSFLTSFLIDDFLAVDAGCLTQTLNLENQAKITDILISHTHLDHTLSLSFLVDNMFGLREEPIRIWSGDEMISGMRLHLFNDVTWPDFSVLPSADKPSLTFNSVGEGQTIRLRHLNVTPIWVNHVVPCFAFFVECTETGACLLYTADTTSTDRVWKVANERPRLDAVIVDCSFPNDMEDLARASGHMTPRLLAQDLSKLSHDCSILVYHIKPMFEQVMRVQLAELNLKNLMVGIQGRVFEL